jgi:hypothetical protein
MVKKNFRKNAIKNSRTSDPAKLMHPNNREKMDMNA